MGLAFSRAPFRRRRRRSSTGSTILPLPAAIPLAPDTPDPADTSESVYTLLTWNGNGASKFDIYLGTNPSPPKIVSNFVGTSYIPTLLPATNYYWKIVAINDLGSTAGPVWQFSTPSATKMIVALAGVIVNVQDIRIQDSRGSAANTANFTTLFPPTIGQDVQIGLGGLDADKLKFAGEVIDVGESYIESTDNTRWPVSMNDYVYKLNKRRPFGTWTNVSASIIGREVIQKFAS